MEFENWNMRLMEYMDMDEETRQKLIKKDLMVAELTNSLSCMSLLGNFF